MLYVVYLCGATDCFAHAAFVREDAANAWGQGYSKNPEGFYVKEMMAADALAALADQD